MKSLRSLLLLCFVSLLVLVFIIIVAYIVKFNGAISDNINDWLLFVSICNFGYSSVIAGLNVWVFFKLTTLIAKNDTIRFIENKLSRTENALMEIRLSDLKRLREAASTLKIAIQNQLDYKNELREFQIILLSMQQSSLFSTIDNKGSVLDPIVEYIDSSLKGGKLEIDKLVGQINSVIVTTEMLIYSHQLRDERILEEVRKHPNWFDSTIIGIDNFMKKYEQSH